MTSIQHVRVEGSAYQRGQQYGTQAAERVRNSVRAYERVFAHLTGWDWPAVRREAARFEAPVGEFRPGYLQEMRGIADGAGLDLADILAINVRTEVMYAAKARNAPLAGHRPAQVAPSAAGPSAIAPTAVAECSAFARVPAPGQPGGPVIGQNWDWLDHAAQTLILLEARPDDGPDFVTAVEAGLLAKAGLNSAGLALVTNALVTDRDVGEPGLPYHVLLRAILDCATVTDALSVLQAGTRSSSANYLVAQAGGAALDIEAAPGDLTQLYLLYPDDGGLLLHTNHFQSSLAGPADLGLWAMPSSAVRLQRLRAGAGKRDLDGFGALLADHADYPHSICAHPDPVAHPLDRSGTIVSLLMDTESRQVWLAAGHPCQVPYQRLDVRL
jgi:isopenicillin-N N-acyltransferase like protein